MHTNPMTYDITLMLRIFDTLCQYQAESIPVEHILSSVKLPDITATSQTPTSQQIQNSSDKIVHSLHKMRVQSGTAYFQPGLQDFFKAVFLCCNINVNAESDNGIVLPVRSFSESHLVMEDGTSVLEQIMEKIPDIFLMRYNFAPCDSICFLRMLRIVSEM